MLNSHVQNRRQPRLDVHYDIGRILDVTPKNLLKEEWMIKENQIEENLIKQLTALKYVHRADIVDRKTLEQNFKIKFEELNRVRLSESEFIRLREEIINPDVFAASKLLRERQYFQREDGTPMHYTLVNIKDWCKNDFEVISQLRINTENSNQRYDVILLINGLPVVQVELKKLDISPRKAMQQIVDYKNEPGNGYSNSLMYFHVDYFKRKDKQNPKLGEALDQQAVAEAIIEKYTAATNWRRFNALFATASINNAIDCYRLFKGIQQRRKGGNPEYELLNIAGLFSTPWTS